MEDRETHSIVTPIKKHEIVLRSWITGREKQRIDGALYSGLDTEGVGENAQPKIGDTMLARQENASITAVVVSIDGNTANTLDRVLDMRSKDYAYVIEQVMLVVDGDFDEKKEISSPANITTDLQENQEQSLTAVSG